MVRTIDGDARRQVLAEAVWRIIRRDGFDAASVRAVAAEASLSTGSVRHFFATQVELHLFAMESLIERMGRRVRDALDRSWPPDGPTDDPAVIGRSARAAVMAVLSELLPLTPERDELFLAHLQFVTRARVQPELAPMAQRLTAENDALVTHLVQSLVDLGVARSDLDVAAASRLLCVLIDGITTRLLTAPDSLSVAQAVVMVEDCLDGWGAAA